MRRVLYNLMKLSSDDDCVVQSLKGFITGQDKIYLDFVVEVKNNTGAYPTPEILNEKFGLGLGPEDVVRTPSKHLAMFYSQALDKHTRKRLLELSSAPSVGVTDLSKLVQECSGVQRGEGSQIELSMEKIYEEITSRPVGCKFFINPLDEEVTGVSYGKICTILGFVSHFKTMTAMSVAYSNAKDYGYNFAVISLEGQKSESYINLMARHSFTLRPNLPLDAKKIKKGLLNEKEVAFLMETEEDFKKLSGKIYLLDGMDISRGGITSEDTIKAALDACNEQTPLDGVVVDYIQLFKHYRVLGAKDIAERMNAVVELFRNFAIHYNEPQGLIVYLLSQANRDGWTRAAKRQGQYALSALSEVNALERSSYYVVALFSSDALAASGELSVQLLKHKGGNKIEEPFTTFVQPQYGLVGDVEGYGNVFTEDTLNESLDVFEDF